MNIKKTTKKTAKKTYPRKKSPPKSRRITVDDLAAVVADTEARIATSHEKTDKALSVLSDSIDKLSAEVRKTSATVRELSNNVGGVNTSFGYIVELVVVPKLRSAVNAAGGYTFTTEKILVDKTISAIIDYEKKDVAEIDMFLFSDTEAMAVEIKAQLHKNHVEKQLERLEKLRKYEEKANIVGKKLFGAVVGIYIDHQARALALKNGLYVIEIREEEDKLDVEKPETCQTW